MKTKICKICGQEFKPQSTVQRVCSWPCAIKYTQQQDKKKEKAIARKQKKAFYSTDRKYQTDLASKACNEYIRGRDKALNCISCDKPNDGSHQRHASHYRPAGTNKQLKFNELNIHASCMQCNSIKSGNLSDYRIRLIKKIGLKNVEWLEGPHGNYKLTLDDIVEIKQYYKEQLKLLT